jgi:site-specific recombinase XerD
MESTGGRTGQDAIGRRRQRKLECHTLQQARTLLRAEKERVELIETKGYAPPSDETFLAASTLFLTHQRARLTRRAYEREEGIVMGHLRPFFGKVKLAGIRRIDAQRYVTERSGKVSPGSVIKELNVLKHLLSLAVEWELISTNPAHAVKSPRVPAGRVRYLQPQELRTVLARCPGGSVRLRF